ncbi:MAG: NADH-quinone oxidoreductase subunit M [Verrucomicrobia bacterium]|jgi:NADH-quinone oxidoreductase subunit M|nr:NADH-quinone oxidoreductase subunit M [Verrucomicrobiota bacterium]
MNSVPLLSLLTFTPLLGGLALLFVSPARSATARRLALAVSGLVLVLTLVMLAGFDSRRADLQFVERGAWVPTLAVEYFLGVDGLGVTLLLLTALVTPLALLLSGRVEERAPLYHSLVLFVQAGLVGTFTAQNFFHWFLYWELSLVPAFFLVRLWGGPERGPAATQFFVYTMVGSIAMLLAFLALFLATGRFNFPELAALAADGGLAAAFAGKLTWASLSNETLALLVFGGVFLGLAVKVPVIPFHTWLPAAYAEAPSPVTMLLTGLMSKMGVYGFLRILVPIFPDQLRAWLTPLLWLAVLTIVCAAAAAFAQRDLKRLLAYSSINHLGYCLLGIFAALRATGDDARLAAEAVAALNGVVLQMFNHGLTASALFGFMALLERRTEGRRNCDDFGGLRQVAPVFCGLMGIAVFSSLGLPGLNGFVGEFLIFKGAFPLAPWAAALSVLGLLITAVFLLTLMQRVFHGPLNPRWASFPDLTTGERWLVGPAIALLFVLGVYPQVLVGVFDATITATAGRLAP